MKLKRDRPATEDICHAHACAEVSTVIVVDGARGRVPLCDKHWTARCADPKPVREVEVQL